MPQPSQQSRTLGYDPSQAHEGIDSQSVDFVEIGQASMLAGNLQRFVNATAGQL